MKKTAVFFSCFFIYSQFAFALDIGQPAPGCTAKMSNSNQPFNPNLFKGKLVLIDFWATWCPPCLKSIPFFNQLSQEFPADKLEIIAINVDENTETAQQFLETNPVNYTMAFDPDGECPKKFGLKAMPSTYLVDKSGNVRHIQLGFHEEDKTTLTDLVNSLLTE